MLVEVPELERRKDHLDLISPTHPLLMVALDCLKDKEGPRPTAEELCSRLIALKQSPAYQDSLQQTSEELAVETAPVRDEELEQQLRESESRVEDLTQQLQQLQVQEDAALQARDGQAGAERFPRRSGEVRSGRGPATKQPPHMLRAHDICEHGKNRSRS